MIKEIKKIILFYGSPFIRVNLVIGFILIFFSLFMILFSNPFSRYNHEERIDDVCVTPGPDDIQFSSEKIGDTMIEYSSRPYQFEGKDYFIRKTEKYGLTNIVTIEPAHLKGQGFEDIQEFSSIKDCDPHPLQPFTRSEKGDIFLLGTTSGGVDYCSQLFVSFANTLKLSLFTLISFLAFGISLGIFLGYYKDRFPTCYSIVNYIQKIIESVPIILWMIISYTFLSSELPNSLLPWLKEIVFILFGIFSSTALSKLLVNKFENFRKEDFIVALKLLGIKDRRIIFVHIIKFYCLPVIIMQMVYIIAQCFFMDITLSVLQFGDEGTIGFMFFIFLTMINANGLNVMILSIFIYLILSSLFYSSEYLKEVSSYD